MDKSDISIATITWARSAGEENLLRESLTQLAALAIPVFVTDGGSGDYFLDFLRRFPHFKVLNTPGRGVWAQAKNSILAVHATASPYILYTEPDKLNFFRDALPSFLAAVPNGDQAGVVVAARSASGFATFPAFQQTTETTINRCCAEIIGKAIDYTYGPFLLTRSLAPYLNLVQEDIGWGWRPYIFGLAHRFGYQVSHFEGNFACPPDQRTDDLPERIYRMRQLSQNIQGLVLSTSIKVA
jgi:hypothetical protein